MKSRSGSGPEKNKGNRRGGKKDQGWEQREEEDDGEDSNEDNDDNDDHVSHSENDDDYEDDDEEGEEYVGEREKRERDKRLTDVLKKIINTGLGAAFATEDAVKTLISEVSLPKDLLHSLLQAAKGTRNDFLSTVKNGLSEYLNHIDISKEIGKVLEKYDVEVQAKISLKKKKGGAEKSNRHHHHSGEGDDEDH